jgi:hypothetical protein
VVVVAVGAVVVVLPVPVVDVVDVDEDDELDDPDGVVVVEPVELAPAPLPEPGEAALLFAWCCANGLRDLPVIRAWLGAVFIATTAGTPFGGAAPVRGAGAGGATGVELLEPPERRIGTATIDSRSRPTIGHSRLSRRSPMMVRA